MDDRFRICHVECRSDHGHSVLQRCFVRIAGGLKLSGTCFFEDDAADSSAFPKTAICCIYNCIHLLIGAGSIYDLDFTHAYSILFSHRLICISNLFEAMGCPACFYIV